MPPSLAEVARELGTSPGELRTFVQTLKKDPPAWAKFAFGSDHWAKQKEIMYAVRDHRVVCVPACHASGKSFTAADLVHWFLFNHGNKTVVVTTAPSERQVRRILWKEIRAKFAAAKIPLPGHADTLQLEISEDHWAIGFATADYDANKFQGIHADYILVVLDEACGVSGEVYEGVMGVIGGGHARLLQLGNPTDPLTQFKRDCDDPKNIVIPISAYDTPNFNIPAGYMGCPEPIKIREYNFTCNEKWPEHWTNLLKRFLPPGVPRGSTDFILPNPHLCTPQFVDNIIRKYGPASPQYLGRVLGQFPEQAENSLFTISEVKEAMEQVDLSKDEAVMRNPLRLGVDVARFGSNQTVIGAYQGDEDKGIYRCLARFSKTDTKITSDRIMHIAKECTRNGLPPLEIQVDVIGVGGGVVDNLFHAGLPVVAFNSANRENIPENFLNTRALAYFQVKEKLERRQLDLPNDETLRNQLLTIRWHQSDTSSQLQILGKEFMRTKGIPSPDDADCLTIATYGGPRGRRDLGVTV